MLDRDDAIRRARDAAEAVLDVPEDAAVEVERAETFVVTFLRDDPPGTRGPDYHARVTLDAETGEVLDLLGGS